MSRAGEAAVADTVTSLFEQCVEAERRMDPEVCLAQMSDAPDFRYFVDVTLYRDADALKERTRRGFAGYAAFDMRTTLDTVIVLGPEAAVVSATIDLSITDTAGATSERTASWSLVYAKRDAVWSIVHGHWSYDVPSSPPPAHESPPRDR